MVYLISCNVLNPPPELTWDHSPDALIIQATSGGGMEPEAAYRNRIPDAQLWGNGRYIWQTFDENNSRQVWEAQLSEDEIVGLLQTFADKGFWRLKDHYEPRSEVFDSSSTSLRVNLLEENKRVGEYHSGAPRKFHELRGMVSSGAGADGQPYIPQSGYLTVIPRDDFGYPDIPVWDAEAAGISLEDILDGPVGGAALIQAWEIVNQQYWAPYVVDGEYYYELFVEIPELTGQETP